MRLYIFRTFPLSIIKSLFTFEQDQDGTGVPSLSCSKAIYRPVWYIPLLSVHWINSWWWTEELPETCRVSCQNKFVKLVHLVGFIIKKFVTMHGHMNVKKELKLSLPFLRIYPTPTLPSFICTTFTDFHLSYINVMPVQSP